jgi:hypothetical protein
MDAGKVVGYGLIAVVATGIGYAASLPFQAYYTHHNVTFTVDKSERVCDSSNSGCRYLIYTDKGVYEDTDSMLNGKWNSSDIYGQIQNGKTYDATVYGWRSGFMSWYPNIVKLTAK